MSASFARLSALLALLGSQLAASGVTAQKTAQVAGVVVTADSTRAPVRQAIVTITATDQQSRGTLTDDQGRFAFVGLSPGRFTLTVSKPAYLSTTYGATSARRSGTSIELGVGAAVTDLVVPISRGAAMSGVVRDASGEPASGVRVLVLPRTAIVRSSDAPELSTFTDDRGAYRLYGLPAGEYALAVIPKSAGSAPIDVMTDALVDAALREQQQRAGRAVPATTAPPSAAHPSRGRSYAPVFYPGTAISTDATWLPVAAGDERTGLDVTVSLVPVALVEGQILGVDGAPTSAAQPTLTNNGPSIPVSVTGSVSPELTMTPGANGVFRFNRVTPGRYTLMARSSPTGPNGASAAATPAWASIEVDVTSDDVKGLELHLQPMLSFSGRVTFPGAPPAPESFAQIRVSLYPLDFGSPQQSAPVASGIVNPDSTFEVRGLVPGSYRMAVSVPARAGATTLWLRSAILDGRELLDAPIDMQTLGNVTGVVAMLSDRHTQLSGVLQTTGGQPDRDDLVVVFPAEQALWQPLSRRIRAARTASDGRYVFADLPPGDYILATLRDGADELQLPEILTEIAPAGVRITLGEGERKTQDLRAR